DKHFLAVIFSDQKYRKTRAFTGFFLCSRTNVPALTCRPGANFCPRGIIDRKGKTHACASELNYVWDYKRYVEAYLSRICIDKAETPRADIIKSLKGDP